MYYMNYPMRLFEKINTLVKFNVVVCYTENFKLVFYHKMEASEPK